MPVTVISRLALGRWIFVAVVVALAAGALFWTAFHPESGASYDPNGPVASIGAARVGGFLGGVACLLGFAYCLYLPISSRGRAVWIEGSELVFVDDFGRHRVPLAEIERTELGTDSANASGVPIVFWRDRALSPRRRQGPHSNFDHGGRKGNRAGTVAGGAGKPARQPPGISCVIGIFLLMPTDRFL